MAGWASGFESGTRIGRSLIDTYQQARQQQELEQQREEIKAVVSAQPIQSEGFTAEQGDQLRAAAESGQYDIAYDEQAKAYTVTPKADPSQTGRITMQGVTDFLGNRTAGAMSEDQVRAVRGRSVADVIGKYDPLAGMRMQREIRQGEREDQRFSWEKSRNEREQRQATEQDQEKALLKQIDDDTGEWFEKRLTNPDGTQRTASVDDHLAMGQYRASQLAGAGKVAQAGEVMKDYNANALIKIKLDEAQRKVDFGQAAAALASGDTGPLVAAYNRYLPDGARVTGMTQGKDGRFTIERETDDGRPLSPHVMETGQILAGLKSFEDTQALYNWSQNEFKNNLMLRAEARADRADARAGATFAQSQADRAEAKADKKAKAEAGVAVFLENNPNASQAVQEAVRRGVLPAVPTADKNAPAEVKLAQAYVRAGLARNEADALRMATQSKADSPEKVRASIYGKALQAKYGDPVAAQKATDEAMQYLFPSSSGAGSSPPAGAAVKVTSQADFTKLPKGTRYEAPDGTIRIKQ